MRPCSLERLPWRRPAGTQTESNANGNSTRRFHGTLDARRVLSPLRHNLSMPSAAMTRGTASSARVLPVYTGSRSWPAKVSWTADNSKTQKRCLQRLAAAAWPSSSRRLACAAAQKRCMEPWLTLAERLRREELSRCYCSDSGSSYLASTPHGHTRGVGARQPGDRCRLSPA